MTLAVSESENNGLAVLRETDQQVYSVGISTGGAAEIRMALACPRRRLIATTLDEQGSLFAKKRIKEAGLSERIDVKIEDVTAPLPYTDGFFDFIYARLVLHYLSKQDLIQALQELHRVLKKGGRLFAVVRSADSWEAQGPTTAFDSITGLTTYTSHGHLFSRFFHTVESMQTFLIDSGFQINHFKNYNERLCMDFQRTQQAEREDALIEVLASK